MTPALGILELDIVSLGWPGTMGHPATFAYPVLRQIVAGATVDNVLRGDPALATAYAAAARSLAAQGAAAITTNCGFAVVYQAAVSAGVGVPVATSSLLLLPLLARLLPAGRVIGIVTFDSRQLGPRHFECAGLAGDAVPIIVAGIEESESWHELAKREPRLTLPILERDVIAAVERAADTHPEISVLLLECAAFCPLTARIREATGYPVLDFVTLADLLMAGVSGREP